MCLAADRCNLPLLELPLELSLAGVMNPIVNIIADNQTFLLKRSDELQRLFAGVAINNGGLKEIIKCLSEITDSAAACYDANGYLLSSFVPQGLADVNLSGSLPHYLPNNDELAAQFIFSASTAAGTCITAETICLAQQQFTRLTCPAIVNQQYLGHLCLLSPTLHNSLHRLALEHARTMATLEILKQKAIADNSKRHAADILEQIFFSDVAPYALLSNTALTSAKFFKCLVLDSNNQDNANLTEKLYKITIYYLHAQYPLSFIAPRSNLVIALIASATPLPRRFEQSIFAKIISAVSEGISSMQISIGISSDISAASLKTGYYDAVESLRLGKILKGAGHITYFDEIACYASLAKPETNTFLQRVCQHSINKLAAFDKQHGTGMLKTLESYLGAEQNLTNTAKNLFIHRNTLANRLERIADIAGIDLNNSEELLCLRLALRASKIGSQGA